MVGSQPGSTDDTSHGMGNSLSTANIITAASDIISTEHTATC